MDVEIVKALSVLLNFRMKFVETQKGEYWGSSQENGSWSGLVGMLSRKEGDIGVANMFISSVRNVAIDYTSPYNSDTACFLIAKPAPFPRWQSILFPFKTDVWIAYICSIFVCGLTFVLLIGNSNIEPKSIDTINELYHSSLRVGAASDFFQGPLAASEDKRLQSFAKEFLVYKEEEELFSRVSEGFMAYLQNRLYLEYKIATRPEAQSGNRGYRIMHECLKPFSIAMGIQKNSPLKRKFDIVLNWLVESGLVRKWFLESLQTQANNVRKQNSHVNAFSDEHEANKAKQTSLSVGHLQGVFLVFLFGTFFSSGIFLLEICIHKNKKTNKQTKA